MVRGYFGVGVEGISKARNLGAVLRTAHAFGASFAFSVHAHPRIKYVNDTDTSQALKHLPYFEWKSPDELRLPRGCKLVGIELTDEAVDLPSFNHPNSCAYILGPEEGSLSPELLEVCDYQVRIPTKFCINVSLAAALTLYDRVVSSGKYPERPMMPGGPSLEAVEEWKRLRQRD